jgi:chromosome segregation ATPase
MTSIASKLPSFELHNSYIKEPIPVVEESKDLESATENFDNNPKPSLEDAALKTTTVSNESFANMTSIEDFKIEIKKLYAMAQKRDEQIKVQNEKAEVRDEEIKKLNEENKELREKVLASNAKIELIIEEVFKKINEKETIINDKDTIINAQKINLTKAEEKTKALETEKDALEKAKKILQAEKETIEKEKEKLNNQLVNNDSYALEEAKKLLDKLNDSTEETVNQFLENERTHLAKIKDLEKQLKETEDAKKLLSTEIEILNVIATVDGRAELLKKYDQLEITLDQTKKTYNQTKKTLDKILNVYENYKYLKNVDNENVSAKAIDDAIDKIWRVFSTYQWITKNLKEKNEKDIKSGKTKKVIDEDDAIDIEKAFNVLFQEASELEELKKKNVKLESDNEKLISMTNQLLLFVNKDFCTRMIGFSNTEKFIADFRKITAAQKVEIVPVKKQPVNSK